MMCIGCDVRICTKVSECCGFACCKSECCRCSRCKSGCCSESCLKCGCQTCCRVDVVVRVVENMDVRLVMGIVENKNVVIVGVVKNVDVVVRIC